ncbi:MAG: hypothetical protein JWM57_491, partial [Phycisphaerales bacterium]|nr:hypothetical protein [Phycisphaerales bacterium]
MMMTKSFLLRGCVIAAMGTAGWTSVTRAVTIDGTLDTGAGYQLVSTQVNRSNSNGDGVQALPAGYGPTYDPHDTALGYVQLANCYAQIDSSVPAAPVLNLFFGGNLNVNGGSDCYLELFLQTHAGGSQNLANFGGGNGSLVTSLP